MINKKKKLALVQRILKQAVKMSSNNIIDVFVNWSSHVELFEARVYLNGWKPDSEADYRKDVWCRTYNDELCIKELREILKYLKGVQKNEINR